MPTPHKRLENQRKHLTKAERAARGAAEQELERAGRTYLRMPAWLSDEARAVWVDVRRKLRTVKLLDNLDAEMLGIYCDAVAQYRAMSKTLRVVDENGLPKATDEQVKQMQAWARIVSAYAEKLGLSPAARARLARKKAEEAPADDMEQLLGEVTEYVNGDHR